MRTRTWLFWVALASLILITLTIASFYLMMRSLRLATPTVSDGSALTIDLARRFVEDPLYDFASPFFDVDRATFRDLIFSIRRAKTDDRISSLLIRARGAAFGWAQAAELRDQLLDFKESGKPVVAYIEYAGNMDYLLATVADQVHMHPQTTLDLRGFRAEVTFMKETFDKIGIEAEFERIGAYKNAPDPFLRDDMSDAQREALSEIVGTLHATLIAAIVEGRGLGEDEAESAVNGPYTAAEAERLGLVDHLSHFDEARDALTPDEDGAPTSTSLTQYWRATRSSPAFGADATVAVVYGLGVIVGGESTDDAIFGRVMGSDTIAQAFRQVREDESIDAVVFRIDSPGGVDVASDVIWREAQLTREEKPVVVSMGNVAASGGYWIATASDEIVAEPTTLTGSIGIYAGKFNLAKFYDYIGFHKESVSSNASGEFWSDYRSFTEEERRRFRRIVQEGYQHFLERVAKSRDKTTEEVDAIAQGRVWSGKMAAEIGLVDELGGLRRALDVAKVRAGFEEDARVAIRIFPRKKSFFESFLTSFANDASARTRGLEALDPRRLLERSPLAMELMRPRTLALMPFGITIE